MVKRDYRPDVDGTAPGLYYGWIVTLAAVVILFLNAQFVYTFGVFVPPMIDKFGWSRAAISSIASVRAIVTAAMSPVGGTLADRYGSRKLMLIGIVLCGLGYVLAWQATSLWRFYVSFGVLIGVANGILITPTLAIVNRWFGGRSALANGIAMSGPSSAQIIVPPVVTFIILRGGLDTGIIAMGLAIWVFGLAALTLVKNPPPAASVLYRANTPRAGRTQEPLGADFTMSETLHTPSFWILFAVFGATAICFHMVSVHIVIAAMDGGATAATAATILTMMGVANTAGRLAVGVADKIGRRLTLIIVVFAQAVTLYALAQASSLTMLYAVATVYGFLYGCTLPNSQSLAVSTFGTRAVGSVLGTLLMGNLLGAAVGPPLGGYIFDVTGSYFAAFVMAAALCGAIALLSLMFKAPRKRPALG